MATPTAKLDPTLSPSTPAPKKRGRPKKVPKTAAVPFQGTSAPEFTTTPITALAPTTSLAIMDYNHAMVTFHQAALKEHILATKRVESAYRSLHCPVHQILSIHTCRPCPYLVARDLFENFFAFRGNDTRGLAQTNYAKFFYLCEGYVGDDTTTVVYFWIPLGEFPVILQQYLADMALGLYDSKYLTHPTMDLLVEQIPLEKQTPGAVQLILLQEPHGSFFCRCPYIPIGASGDNACDWLIKLPFPELLHAIATTTAQTHVSFEIKYNQTQSPVVVKKEKD